MHIGSSLKPGFNSGFSSPYSPTNPSTGAQTFGAQFGVSLPGIVATGNNGTEATEGDSFAGLNTNATHTSPTIIGGKDIDLGTVPAAGVAFTFTGDFGWRFASGDITTEEVVLSTGITTPLASPFHTRFGIRTFDVDITGRTDRLFFRIQDSDPSP